jgi:hypothetical protein
MLHILHHLNYLPVLVVTIIGFAFGGLWYSKVLFANAWREEVKLTEEQCKAGSGRKMLLTFLATFVFTAVLDALITLRGAGSLLGGAKFGLVIGIGIAAALQGPAALFENRTCRYRAIVIGHSVLLCVLAGAILAVYR